MNRIKFFAAATALLMAWTASLPTQAQKREHRSTWMSGYIQDWPTGKITAGNAEQQKKYCLANLDTLRNNNFTTVYFHARTMCDAFYDSKYEPWSSYIVAKRGQTPAFDPMKFIVEEGHKRGIEVYAWLNPYRYLNSAYYETWADSGQSSPLNYEESHPDWLLKWTTDERTWTILNPAKEEVKQRIVDVIADIVDKYDVDGIVFDDYFYQDGLPLSYDAADYNAYTAGGGTLSQADWRRENINDMVRRVNDYLKKNKPWIRFGISPAGVAASQKAVADKYGVTPCPGSDWQYNKIFSDPLAWLSEGSIDFISPQVYWEIGYQVADFGKITPWWYTVSAKFRRHCYISQSLSRYTGAADLGELENEMELVRTSDTDEAPGFVYFPWKQILNLRARVDGKLTDLPVALRRTIYPQKSLTPRLSWVEAPYPGTATNVSRSGRELTWSGPDNVRFTVYAVPNSVDKAAFKKDAQYLIGNSYGKSFTISEKDIPTASLNTYNYAVAVLDRYGNEYSAVFEGAAVTEGQKPALTYPANGSSAPEGFRFAWNGTASVYEIAIADNAEMKQPLVKREVSGNTIDAASLYEFDPDRTYYWTVTARGNNTTDARSDVNTFTVDVFRILSPADGATGVADDPTVTWNEIAGASYRLTVSKDSKFATTAYETETNEPSAKIPAYKLSGGTTYYAKVVATVDGKTSESQIGTFTTKAIIPTAPVLDRPNKDGETLYANGYVGVVPQRGVTSCKIMVSSTTAFAPRTSYTGSFSGFDFRTPSLQEIKLISTPLADGKTYYARANFTYIDEEGDQQTSAWSNVVSFVYSANAGIGETSVPQAYIADGNHPVLHAGIANATVAIYGIDGRLAASLVTDASGLAKIPSLSAGTYIVAVGSQRLKLIAK